MDKPVAAAIKRGSEWVQADDEWDMVGNGEGLSGFFCVLFHFKPNLRKELGDDYDADPIDDDKSGMFQFRFDEFEAGRKAIDASAVLHIKPDWKGTIYIFYLANRQNVLAWVDGEVIDFLPMGGD